MLGDDIYSANSAARAPVLLTRASVCSALLCSAQILRGVPELLSRWMTCFKERRVYWNNLTVGVDA